MNKPKPSLGEILDDSAEYYKVKQNKVTIVWRGHQIAHKNKTSWKSIPLAKRVMFYILQYQYSAIAEFLILAHPNEYMRNGTGDVVPRNNQNNFIPRNDKHVLELIEEEIATKNLEFKVSP